MNTGKFHVHIFSMKLWNEAFSEDPWARVSFNVVSFVTFLNTYAYSPAIPSPLRMNAIKCQLSDFLGEENKLSGRMV